MIASEEFLRCINTTHESENYEADKITLAGKQTVRQRLVASDIMFDPEEHFPERMIFLDLGKPDSQWEIRTADDLRRKTQNGHQSLKEKYRKTGGAIMLFENLFI